MNKKARITEAEWPIMQVLWERGTSTASEIVDAVTRRREVSMRTVKTLIRRLIAKRMISFTVDATDSRLYHYTAAISREAGMRDKNEAILNLVYEGNAGDLLANFVQNVSLSRSEIDRLSALLARKKAEDNG